jgi:PPOX class probable F420-dependent enzyme
VARLGTVAPSGVPRLVPCCFAVDGRVAYSAVDDKPKRSRRLARLCDLVDHPVATLLVDHYEEDWTRLWWVRAGGPAWEVAGDHERERATGLLRAKYAQYREHRLDGAILAIALDHWRSWSAT